MTKADLRLIKSKTSQSEAENHLSPAQQAEIARFRAFTAEKAARKAKVHRLMVRLQKWDEASPAA